MLPTGQQLPKQKRCTMQEKTDSSSVPPPTMSIVEQVESNMRNLQNLVLGAENLLRTKSIQEGASPMALEQLRASLEAAKEKMMEAANIRGIIKRHAYVGYICEIVRI